MWSGFKPWDGALHRDSFERLDLRARRSSETQKPHPSVLIGCDLLDKIVFAQLPDDLTNRTRSEVQHSSELARSDRVWRVSQKEQDYQLGTCQIHVVKRSQSRALNNRDRRTTDTKTSPTCRDRCEAMGFPDSVMR